MLNEYVLGFSLFNGTRFLKDEKMYLTTNISKKNKNISKSNQKIGVFGNIAQLMPNGELSYSERLVDEAYLPDLIHYDLKTENKLHTYTATNITHESYIGSNIPRYYTPYFDYNMANDEILYMSIIPNRELNILNYFIFIKDKDDNIIWGWDAFEHIQEFELTQEEYDKAMRQGAIKTGIKLFEGFAEGNAFHFNSAYKLGENIWYDQGDERFHPDNIFVTSRTLSCVFIIDYQTKKIVWKIFGIREKLFARPHYGHIIPKGLNGSGNLLIVNNEKTPTSSSILEINPITKEVLFEWDGFHTRTMGSVQKLTNGNYLVGESINQTVYEVSPKGEIVDKYIDKDKQFYRVNAYPKDWFKEEWFELK